jgi:hypothetical protein
MAQEPSLAGALRGTKLVAKAFFTVVDTMPESQRQAIGAAALDLIRDDMKARRDKAAAAAQAKASKPAASEGRAVRTKVVKTAAKKAAPIARARKAKAVSEVSATSPAQAGNGAAAGA